MSGEVARPVSASPPAPVLAVRGRSLLLDRTLVMGVVNASPESFSDGGLRVSTADRVAFAGEMIAAGADVIDVGGQSAVTNQPELDAREELGGVPRAPVQLFDCGDVLEALAVLALHAHGGGGGGRVEADQVHRATVTRRRSPPSCSRRTRAATRSPAGSAISGHSTKATRSGVR